MSTTSVFLEIKFVWWVVVQSIFVSRPTWVEIRFICVWVGLLTILFAFFESITYDFSVGRSMVNRKCSDKIS